MSGQPPILVLVTLQHSCARLIRRGADMALMRKCPLLVLHVAPQKGTEMGEPGINAKALDYLYALAGEAGAEMCVLTSDVPVTAMANYAQEHGVWRVVMGGGARAHGIAETLCQLLPGVQISILEDSDLSA